MDITRPILVVFLLLATLTLIYSGRWAGMDPRPLTAPSKMIEASDTKTAQPRK